MGPCNHSVSKCSLELARKAHCTPYEEPSLSVVSIVSHLEKGEVAPCRLLHHKLTVLIVTMPDHGTYKGMCLLLFC